MNGLLYLRSFAFNLSLIFANFNVFHFFFAYSNVCQHWLIEVHWMDGLLYLRSFVFNFCLFSHISTFFNYSNVCQHVLQMFVNNVWLIKVHWMNGLPNLRSFAFSFRLQSKNSMVPWNNQLSHPFSSEEMFFIYWMHYSCYIMFRGPRK